MSLCVKYGYFEGPGGKGAGLPGGLIKPLLDGFNIEMHWASLVFLTCVFPFEESVVLLIHTHQMGNALRMSTATFSCFR